MANKIAPYNNPATLQQVQDWWTSAHPEGRAEHTRAVVSALMGMFLDYDEYTGQVLWSPNYITPNQFAKCITALQITDIGNGTYAHLPSWTPKHYEIARSKVY